MSEPELLTEEDIITGHEGASIDCPDPKCHCTPGLQWIVRNGECFCGADMAIYLRTEEVEEQ